MQKYLKITVLTLLIGFWGFSWLYPRWNVLSEIYSSPEIRERLSLVPEEVHQLEAPDRADSKTFSMGYASFSIPKKANKYLIRKTGEEAESIWLIGREMQMNFDLPIPVSDSYATLSMLEYTGMTKTEWRQNRMLKATDSFNYTRIALPDLLLYHAQCIPLPYSRTFFMSNSHFGYYVDRLKSKLKDLPPPIERIIPFESKHVVGVVYLCSKNQKYGVTAFIFFSSSDRQIEQKAMACNLPEESSDILEPVWQVLSDYKFNFETCPDIAEIRELIKESGLPESNVTVVMNCLGLESKEDLAEHLDTLISKDKNAINKFIDQSIDSEKAVKIFKGDEVIVLERNNHFVKVRRQQDATNYWILDFNLESESDKDYQNRNNKSNSELNSKPKKESANLD